MRTSIQIAVAALIICASTAHAADVNVHTTVSGQVSPGVYGRVEIGNTPPPVVYAQPVIIAPRPVQVAPVYMRVPPGHAKKWSKHCHKYNACGVTVYFVRTKEYEGHHHHGEEHGHGRGHGHRD